MQISNYDVIIIGGGPGGYTAALYAVRAGLKTLVIEKLAVGGQMAETDQIDNYPGFHEGVIGFDLAERMAAGAENFGAATAFEEVVSVNLARNPKRIVTNRNEYEAEAVILATGAAPRLLDLPGERQLTGGRGVAYCAACDGMFYKDRTVAVIGSGNSAAADAILLSNICRKVYLIHRYDEPRTERTALDLLRNAMNVEMLPNSEVVSLLYSDRLTGLAVRDTASDVGCKIDCDAAFIAIGRKPNTELFAGQLDLTVQGYIMAGEDTRTNLPGVFAVGDVRTKPVRQIVTAAADGASAAKFAEQYVFFGRTPKLEPVLPA